MHQQAEIDRAMLFFPVVADGGGWQVRFVNRTEVGTACSEWITPVPPLILITQLQTFLLNFS